MTTQNFFFPPTYSKKRHLFLGLLKHLDFIPMLLRKRKWDGGDVSDVWSGEGDIGWRKWADLQLVWDILLKDDCIFSSVFGRTLSCANLFSCFSFNRQDTGDRGNVSHDWKYIKARMTNAVRNHSPFRSLIFCDRLIFFPLLLSLIHISEPTRPY